MKNWRIEVNVVLISTQPHYLPNEDASPLYWLPFLDRMKILALLPTQQGRAMPENKAL